MFGNKTEIDENKKNYINASFINVIIKFFIFYKGPLENDEHKNLFIATQGPLTNTIESFWLMIINNNSNLIVSLANTYEDGRVKIFNFYFLIINSQNFKFIGLKL